jgi:uncharacterized membrane protein YhiD involved in acid resistance
MLSDPTVQSAEQLLIRLLVALVLGGIIVTIYRRVRSPYEIVPSFTVTLVMLVILIAMVTQVIGESVARAFSLVGALSIIRFRTIVRDTQDTAYVICSVACGMAAGQGNFWAAGIGLAVVALAAFLMRRRHDPPRRSELPYVLDVRMGLGHDAAALLGPTLNKFVGERRVAMVSTAKQGMSIDLSYRTALRSDDQADELVKTLNQLEGVQSVTLHRIDAEDE